MFIALGDGNTALLAYSKLGIVVTVGTIGQLYADNGTRLGRLPAGLYSPAGWDVASVTVNLIQSGLLVIK